jgi:hypothetical protein
MYLFIYFAYLFDEEQFLEKMNRSSTWNSTEAGQVAHRVQLSRNLI